MERNEIIESLEMMIRQSKYSIEAIDQNKQHFLPRYMVALMDNEKTKDRDQIINDLYPFICGQYNHDLNRLMNEVKVFEAILEILKDDNSRNTN